VISENKGFYLPSEVNRIPENPGVYLMKDAKGKVIYVGKAKNLKKRVSSYFQKKNDSEYGVKTRFLVENIAIIDTIAVENESEALILEANLIKQYMPRYNVSFKDNKFYPFIALTMRDDFPRILFTRERRKDLGSRYFGPYTNARSVREYIDLIQRLFKIRTCVVMPRKECILYHINRCTAPCIHKIEKEKYGNHVREASELLSGNSHVLLKRLEKEMKEEARLLQFEKAQSVKEKIDTIRTFEDSQNVFLESGINADFLAMTSHMGHAVFVVTMIRNGKMIGKRSYSASLQLEEELPDLMFDFLTEYDRDSDARQEFYIIDEKYSSVIGPANSYFSQSGRKVRVSGPGDDKQRSLLHMALENAALHMNQILSKVDASEGLRLLQETLELDTLPMRIEGFDIADILGLHAVASLVSFFAGKPDKKNYRIFKIRSKSTPDDFAMINEAVSRRYKRLIDEDSDLPDLVLIDGGRGQLNAALEAIAGLNVSLNVVSLAKKNEEIYTPYREKPIVLSRNSPALHILQQVRDETHRFANSYYNRIKNKKDLESVFDGIKGIGKKRKQIILENFLSYDIMKDLNVESLIRKGIPSSAAQYVLEKIRLIADDGDNP
jgi:excinuclease ABC subunit C